MNQQQNTPAGESFQIDGKKVTETAVHIYATVRVRVTLEPTQDPKAAVEKALERTDLFQAFRNGEYADGITDCLVDQVAGSFAAGPGAYETLSETLMTEDGHVQHAELERGRFIVLSTSHVTAEDDEILDNIDPVDVPVMIAVTGSGWVISLRPSSQDDPEELGARFKEYGFSDTFVTLWKGMRERGYGLMQLDADAAAHPEFKTFAW